MNLSRTSLALASAACLVALGTPASAAAGTPGGAASETHCVIVVDKVKPGETVSKVVPRGCFTGSESAARAEAAVPVAAAETHLMTWAEHADYGGAYTHIYGSAGPCDSAGYSFRPGSWWSSRLSSFLVEGGCNKSYLSGPRGNGSFDSDVPYVGDTLNDAVTYIKVWRG
ncbi:hypothetical protein [Streptomyces sp. NBC_01481]|uniref:hypothetical protein n=1 Tax=Streptomyces sp. NBC_01481 TaxID=2975869 RepID=UPI0022541DB8|nr:hypothetical protein [Streptomyces sp. NBC_01481]MCX4582919.1 hypothetical protein [Streptomyces sp. NBC_01481]